jgi:hypothetical protein
MKWSSKKRSVTFFLALPTRVSNCVLRPIRPVEKQPRPVVLGAEEESQPETVRFGFTPLRGRDGLTNCFSLYTLWSARFTGIGCQKKSTAS